MICSKCGLEKPVRREKSRECAECYAAYMRIYNQQNREAVTANKRAYHYKKRLDPEWVAKQQKRGREYWNNLRHETIIAYGGYSCACCGETEPKFLSLDHVFNDGAAHRRQIGETSDNGKGIGARTWKWCKDHGFPAGFQVLCMNCNFGKARNKGICPHKTSLENRVKTGEAQTG